MGTAKLKIFWRPNEEELTSAITKVAIKLTQKVLTLKRTEELIQAKSRINAHGKAAHGSLHDPTS